jgi:hypothetical protein
MNLTTLANYPTEPAHGQRISLNSHREWMNFAHPCIMGRQSRHRQSKNQMALFKRALYSVERLALSCCGPRRMTFCAYGRSRNGSMWWAVGMKTRA